MQMKVFGFLFLVGFGGLGALSVVQAQQGQQPPVSTEEEAPALPVADVAPPPPAATTVDPLGALKERAKHKLFPLTETDEAYKAYYGDKIESQPKTMDDRQRMRLLEGACGDEAIVGNCNDQLSEMDYGASFNSKAKREALRKRLDAYVPGITTEDAVRRVARGRVNWTIWSGGNDRFWNYMTQATFGGVDLLKTLSNYKSSTYRVPVTRNERWQKLGITNEPCFQESKNPRADRFGLWLDVREDSAECRKYLDEKGQDPWENEELFRGIEIGARGKTVPVGSMYGYGTGVVGLRLFPNPDFDDKARARWDAKQYYENPNYYNDPKLVRPYRVGMACAFCHVGPNPTNPPSDFNNPKWANLNSNPGAQYFWVDRILLWNWNSSQDNFIYQLLHTSRPGALDTSLISSDQINNPRTMNAVYDFPARVKLAAMMGHREILSGGELNNAQFNTVNDMARNWQGNDKLVPASAAGLRELYEGPHPRNRGNHEIGSVVAPRVLKDGSDSVGVLGALNRVYVNIGLFSEDWIQNFIPVVGGARITPFKIDTAMRNSLYWQANVNQTSDTALFFLATSDSDLLSKAGPIGRSYLKQTENRLEPKYADSKNTARLYANDLKLGKRVFANACARCHSSKLPPEAYAFFNKKVTDRDYCNGPNYLSCWNRYWAYTKTPAFKSAMEKMVVEDSKFLVENFLSNDQRVPANLLDSNLCSPIATNGLKDNIWNDFSSTSYKDMPPIGTFKVAQASLVKGRTDAVDVNLSDRDNLIAGGRGYLRPASLSSIWSTAPFLGNNALGYFDYEGTVQGRMRSFEDSVRRLLWPQDRVRAYEAGKRLKESRDLQPGEQWPDEYGARSGKQVVTFTTNSGSQLKGIMDVSTTESYLKLPRGYVPSILWKVLEFYGSDFVRKAEVYASGPVARTAGYSSQYGDEGATNYSDDQMGDYLAIGPIPAGVPVNLISNIDLENMLSFRGNAKMMKAVYNLVKAVADIRKNKLSGDAATQYFMNKAAGPLLKVSKCTDFVVNRGHYFGTDFSPDVIDKSWTALDGTSRGLTDEEKEALIKYLKTM